MGDLSYDNITLGYIQIFEGATQVHPKDCIVAEGKVVFLVNQNDVIKAVGRRGERAEMLKALVKREIQVIAYSQDTTKFVMNVFYPFSPVGVVFEQIDGGRHATVQVAEGWKARAIGKEGKNLKIARAILSRHSDIVSVKVA